MPCELIYKIQYEHMSLVSLVGQPRARRTYTNVALLGHSKHLTVAGKR